MLYWALEPGQHAKWDTQTIYHYFTPHYCSKYTDEETEDLNSYGHTINK